VHDREAVRGDDVTVVLATYDESRWPHLAAAVGSVLAQRPEPAAVIVAVDHNARLRDRVAATWPQVHVVENGHARGASGTRNAGAKAATTPLVAFLDDDARAREGWLRRLVGPLADPEVVGTGGPMLPVWERGGAPRWFPPEFGWVVAASYPGLPTSVAMVRNVWSANMAVRMDAFRAAGGFRTDFGKTGDRARPEDTHLCISMARVWDGGRWMYVPDAVVDHQVPAPRSRPAYFLRRSFAEGAGKVEMTRLLGKGQRLDPERDYVRRVLPTAVVAGVSRAARSGKPEGLMQSAAIVIGLTAAGAGAISAMTKGRVQRSTRWGARDVMADQRT
jgi:GT2 family glycosyltransferase